jgi:HlyD family secretion protein
MNTKSLVRVAVVAVVVAALVAGLAWVWTQQRPAEDPNRLTLYGNVDIRQLALAFNGSERIASLSAREGDAVRAGQVLGRLDTTAAELRLALAQAQVGMQEQALRRLQAGSRPQEQAQAQAQLAAAQAQAELATRQLVRTQATSDATDGKGVSRQDLDNARAQQQVTLAQADAARKAAELVLAGPRREDIAQAQQALAAAQAAMALVQRQIDESELRAPTDAVVRARLLEPGEMATPQRPVYTLAITAPKWLRAYVDEIHLGRVRVGMPAQIRIDSDPESPLSARVSTIGSVAEFTPKTVQTPALRTSLVYELRLQVDDPDNRLRLGMPATAQLDLGPQRLAASASAATSASPENRSAGSRP